MIEVYVEPRPKGYIEDAPITHYVLELAPNLAATDAKYKTEHEAVVEARLFGFHPLVALVRNPSQSNAAHWSVA